ncbi:MAG: NAD(P)/FAD-dependent oxidoreductase [Deltaproteobacteria bacterium]|nr:NAD(P)/FAD-dependent oxidoreductase [Deltaproteobacteria bacterium]
MRRLGARLRSMASAAGAELRERTRAESFEFDGGRPRILTVRGESGEEQIRADLFVDATGRRGALRSLSPALRTWCSDALPSDLCTAAQEVRRIEDTRHAADFLGRYDAKDGDALSFLGIAGGFSTLTIHVHVDRAEIAILTGAIADGRHPDGPQMMKKFLERESWIGEKIFGGSGLIPLRRPFARQAVPGLALIGNAGSQVFPAHGSGIGSGLIAARLLAESAAAYDDVGGLEPLWAYQQRFQRTIGAVNAAYDQFRLFSQTLSGGEVGDLLGAGLMRASSSLAALDQKIPAIGIGEGAALTFAAARAPRLAARFIRPVRAMRRAYAHYLAYPQTPDDDALRTWAARESELFS